MDSFVPINPLVRTNLLLAAKRHKNQAKARAVVALLESYLERRAAQADAARSRRQYEGIAWKVRQTTLRENYSRTTV